ncbi:WYL domain-containing protein [Streptomyces sp. NPDC048516]|uniref:WYL domain-containing protein n=1 Tax=Streptomyces sp. NPDC048516 TaxID=3365565 RepID=UPI00371E7BC3
MRHTNRHIHAALTTSLSAAHATLGRLAHLRYTLTTTHRVQIAYRKENGETSVRIVEPDKVWRSKAGDWCLRAHDLLRDASRTFRLDRITALETA